MTERIQLIVVDLDGTLLNSQHALSERTEKTLKAAMEQGVKVIIATGKTRGSAKDIIAQLGLTTPGIYVQGLVVYNGDGTIRYQKTLDKSLIRKVITFAEDRGFSIMAYSGDNILVRSINADIGVVLAYNETHPKEVGPLQNHIESTPINKIIAIKKGEIRKVNALRWQLSMQVEGIGRVMQAGVPDMLEVLPLGISKASALKTLLKEMDIRAENVIALGDGENDIEMIRLAGIGIAMGNADAAVKEAADYVVSTNDEDGVAEAIERFVLPKPVEPETPTEAAPVSTEADASPKPESETEAPQAETETPAAAQAEVDSAPKPENVSSEDNTSEVEKNT